jgi:hypothetical protein
MQSFTPPANDQTPSEPATGPVEAAGSGRDGAGPRRPRRRIWPWIVLVVVLLIVAVAAATAWVGSRAFEAKGSLERAQTILGELEKQAGDGDFVAIVASNDELQRETANAVDMSSDPVWRAFEYVPVAGKNLVAFREIAAVVDSIATGAVDPIVSSVGGGFERFAPVDGRIDVQLVAEVSASVATADDTLIGAAARLETVDAEGTISQLAEARTDLGVLLGETIEQMSAIRKTTELLAPMLGADGPRKYIMLFQNNAESTSLGGNTAAWVILNVDNGAISIGEQPSSRDFPRNMPAPILVPSEAYSVYPVDYFQLATNMTIRPDFPSSAMMTQAFWERESGVVADGVIAFDPVALGYLLEATGPITLPTGQELNSDNAVSLLLSDVYKIYNLPSAQDTFFAAAAAAVFGTLTSSTPDVGKLVDALVRSAEDDRLLAWSARPEEQALIAGTKLEGILPKDNAKETEIGVFFIENSISKMAYYLKTATSVTSTQCETPAAPVFNASVSVHSDISMSDYRKLPAYVRSAAYTDPIKTRTQVYVYGPVGSSYTGFTWDGAGLESEVTRVGYDLGRPVAVVNVDLRPGEKTNINVSFTGAEGAYGPLTTRVTPMVQATAVTEPAGCAG